MYSHYRKSLEDYKLYLFDLDGTLVEPFSADILPGVQTWFDTHTFSSAAVVTNQGGVGLRHWMEIEGFGHPEEYPTQEDVDTRIFDIQHKLNIALTRVYVCYAYQSKKTLKWGPAPVGLENDSQWTPFFRKPNPGMLLQACVDCDVMREDVLFVGDSDEDDSASRRLPIDFVIADEFFGRLE